MSTATRCVETEARVCGLVGAGAGAFWLGCGGATRHRKKENGDSFAIVVCRTFESLHIRCLRHFGKNAMLPWFDRNIQFQYCPLPKTHSLHNSIPFTVVFYLGQTQSAKACQLGLAKTPLRQETPKLFRGVISAPLVACLAVTMTARNGLLDVSFFSRGGGTELHCRFGWYYIFLDFGRSSLGRCFLLHPSQPRHPHPTPAQSVSQLVSQSVSCHHDRCG